MPSSVAKPPVFTILLVEDEDAVRDVTRQVLESAGYRVLEASGPAAALQIADRFEGNIHLLLTDIVMPSMNGHDLASHLLASNAGLIRVFMSGYANDALLRQSLGKPPVWYIQKPFTVNVLLSRIAEALGFPPQLHRPASSPRLPI